MTNRETLAEVCAQIMPPPGFTAAQVLAAAREACANAKIWRDEAIVTCERGEYFDMDVRFYIMKNAIAARDDLLKAPQ